VTRDPFLRRLRQEIEALEREIDHLYLARLPRIVLLPDPNGEWCEFFRTQPEVNARPHRDDLADVERYGAPERFWPPPPPPPGQADGDDEWDDKSRALP
jgi:hypothetical protein